MQERENLFWETGRKIFIEESSYCKPEIINQNDLTLSSKFALVLNSEGLIIGIGELEEDLIIKPKVVFNAKG